MQVVIVGAGLAGLSAALHLIGAGHRVTVIEQDAAPGGRAGSHTIVDPDSREHLIDHGASVLTMPELVVDALTAGGMTRDDADALLDLVPVRPAYAGRLHGSVLHVPDELDAPEHLHWQQRMFDAAYPRFIAGDAALRSYANRADLRALGRLVRLGALRSMQYQVNRRVSDEHSRRMLTFQALYAGVPPSAARAVYAVISHMDVGLGVFYPRGGMGVIGAVMARQIAAAGSEVLLGHTVIGLDGQRGRVTGLRARPTGGGATLRIGADAVVLTPDAPVTDRLLAPLGGHVPRRGRLSPSAVVAHLDVDPDHAAAWPTQAHHTLDFGTAWERTFAEVAAPRGRGAVMSDPSVLITRPSVTVGERRPVSVLAPCPNLESAALDWDAMGGDYLATLLRQLGGRGYRGIDTAPIVGVDTPADWLRQGYSAGTPFAAAHTAAQTGPLRRRQRVRGLANAVLAGSLTHPGVGVPPVLISGRIAARIVADLATTLPHHRRGRD